jgi:hypothetical protein
VRFHLPYNFPYKHDQGQNSASCRIVFERQYIFRENYASVKMLSADIFASVAVKELYSGVRRREFQTLPCKRQLKWPLFSDDVIHGYEFVARPPKGFGDFLRPHLPKYSQFRKAVINPLQN